MTAPTIRAVVRSEITAGLVALLDREGQRGVGRLLGLDHSQVSRRGLDLDRWTVAELVDLLAGDAAYRARVAQALSTGAQGTAATATRDAMAEVGLAAQTSGAIAEALSDGRISPSEAAAIRQRILMARVHEDAHLLPALAEIERGSRG